MSTEYTTTGNGSQTNYSFTFPYLKESDIKATVAGVAKTQGTGSAQWQFHNATTVKFNTAPANGAAIRIYRETADTNLAATFYAGSAIKSQDLNDNFTQNLYVTQEVRDDSALALSNSREHDGDGTYTTAIAKADAAVTTANAADAIADNAKLATDRLVATTANNGATWTLAGNNTNASTDPKGVGYAVTTSESANTTAGTANTNATAALNNSRESDGSGGYNSAISIANTAKTTADTASSNATTAVNTANAADTIADNAKLATDRLVATTSNNGATWTLTGNNTNASTDPKGVGYAVTTAESANTTAASANTTAGQANTTAGTANTNATAALNNSRESDGSGGYTSAISIANTALTNSRESDGSGGFNTAISIANTAKSTADTSAATVANSAIYQVVANYAALPALNSVDNGKFYQVNDTTNIENNFSSITGEPAGFTGHSGLTVKLKSNTTASPKVWEWQEYYANDPETRYRKKLIVENVHTIDEDYTIGTNNNAFSVGPVTVGANKTLTIPANSLYLLN